MKKQPTSLGDAEIRLALRSRLFPENSNWSDTVLIEELGVCRGQVRIDIAVVNGILHGYEIKSDRDSLRRLAAQADVYGKVVDRATLVVGDRHLTESLDILPAWWGVIRTYQSHNGLIRFETVRKGRRNSHQDPRSLVELLWLDEALDFLIERDVARGVRGKPRRIVWDKVCEHFNVSQIAAQVRSALKARPMMRVRAPHT